jgi:hypothetical protein
MSEQKPDLNVYGHNLPPERGVVRDGIREKQGGEPSRKPPQIHALDAHPELEQTPMPPRNAPFSDEEPS